MREPTASAPIADIGLELPELFCHKRGPDDMEQPTIASPGNASMHNYLAPRKSARLADRRSPADPLRQIRLHGFAGRLSRVTGHFGRLPLETLEQVLGYCPPKSLAALETTCSYFIKCGITDRVARHHLRHIPRAKGLKPDIRRGETYVTLYNFVTAQSNAAAQGTAIALGTYHTVALLCSATERAQRGEAASYALHTMGRGFHGQLGLGDYEQRPEPRRVPAVVRDRVAVPLPELHHENADDRSATTSEAASVSQSTIQLRRSLRSTRSSKARSMSSRSQQSTGTAPQPSASSSSEQGIQLAVVAAGSSHTASISRRGELFTWGLASSGELGHGGWTPIEVCVPRMVSSLHRVRIVSVAAGANHTLAISEAGQLWSCGRGRHGQLGHGAFHDEGVLTPVEAMRAERVVSAAAGKAHSLALAADGRLFAWGDARYGQLGHAALARVLAERAVDPARASFAVPYPQPVAALDPARLAPPARVTAIAAGGDHSVAVTVGGGLLAFGSNRSGQLGLSDLLDRHVPTPVPLNLTNDIPARAVQAVCGAAHTVALVNVAGRARVLASGDASYGQTGAGDRERSVRFYPVRGPMGAKAVCVASGDWHSAAVCADGELFAWGRGDCGQLGLGDDRSRWTPTLVPHVAVVHPDRTLRRNRWPVPRAILLSAAERRAWPESESGR